MLLQRFSYSHSRFPSSLVRKKIYDDWDAARPGLKIGFSRKILWFIISMKNDDLFWGYHGLTPIFRHIHLQATAQQFSNPV